MSDWFAQALAALDDEAFVERYGRWAPLSDLEVASILGPTRARWWIAGGRAARLGAQSRLHDDVDVVISVHCIEDVLHAFAHWHVWENNSGALRPLFASGDLTPGCTQLWVRRSADQPWVADILIDYSTDQWSYKLDPSVTIEWGDAIVVGPSGVPYLRSMLALLHKAHLDRPKDRADLAAAVLSEQDRGWLVHTLHRLGFVEWSRLAAAGWSSRDAQEACGHTDW